MAIGRLHAMLRRDWVAPRQRDDVWVHNFGSDKHLIAVQFRGGYYEGHLRTLRAGTVETATDEQHLDYELDDLAAEPGRLEDVCAELEDLMRDILATEGKDPESFC